MKRLGLKFNWSLPIPTSRPHLSRKEPIRLLSYGHKTQSLIFQSMTFSTKSIRAQSLTSSISLNQKTRSFSKMIHTNDTHDSQSLALFPHHPIQPSTILDTLTQIIPEEEITQQSLLLPLDQLIALPDTFAVIHIGGHQYKVTQDDQIMIQRTDLPINTLILLDKILLLGSKSYTLIGQPLLPTVKVLAQVEEQDKSRKVIIYKKKRRKTYEKKTGHRQPYTLLRIINIMGSKHFINFNRSNGSNELETK